jgi:hypothetical protein
LFSLIFSEAKVFKGFEGIELLNPVGMLILLSQSKKSAANSASRCLFGGGPRNYGPPHSDLTQWRQLALSR